MRPAGSPRAHLWSSWVQRSALVLGIGALCALAGCAAAETGETTNLRRPLTDGAARRVLSVMGSGEVSRLDQWVLRPDEYGAVAVDHARNLLYVGGREGKLIAVGLDDGRPRWERDFGGGIGGHPVIYEGDLLLLGTEDGTLHAVDLETHADRWFYATDGVIRNRPVVEGGVVYVSNSQNSVFALDVRSGAWRWQYQRPQPAGFTIHGRAGVTVRPGGDVMSGDVLYTGFDDGRLVSIDTASGEALAVADFSVEEADGFSDVDSTPLIDVERGQLVVATQGSGVVAVDLDGLETRWQRPMRGAQHVVAGPAGTILVVSSLEGVVALDGDGRERWRARMNTGTLSSPVVVGDTIFISHAEEGLYALDARSGEILVVFETGSGMSAAPVFDAEDRRLYAISNRGRLFVFNVLDDV